MNKSLVLITLAVLLCFSGSALTEELTIHKGEKTTLNDYVFSYEEVGSNTYFEIGVKEEGTTQILEQIPEERVFEEDDLSYVISEDLQVSIDEIGSDMEGLYLNLSLTASEDIFADAKLDSSAPRRVFVGQGEEVTVPLTLRNTGIVNQSFKLSAQQNSSASVSFNYQDFNISRLQVDAGDQESISAEFDVPETAESGTYNVMFVAEDRSRTVESTVIEIRESSSREERKRIDLSTRQNYLGIKPGESKEISIRLRNGGEAVLDNIEISLDSPNGWDTEITQKSVPALERYESFSSVVTIEAPANAEPGDKFLEISAASDETSTEDPERIRLTVQQQSNLRYIGLGIMALSLGGLVLVYRKLGRR